MRHGNDFLGLCRRDFRGRRSVSARHQDDERQLSGRAELLRGGDRLPRRPIQFSIPLFGDDQNHHITRASSRSLRTSSFAASAAEPPMLCVFLALSGRYRLTIFSRGEADAGALTLRISFFLAAMMPLSVA